jgi:hypothetical protein
MKKILSFAKFVFEQETSDPNNTQGPETERQQKSRIAKSLVKGLFGGFSGDEASIDSKIEETPEVKDSLPYKGCGATEPYALNKIEIPVSGFKTILEHLDGKGAGSYTRVLKELEEKRSVIIGLRNKLNLKKETGNQDRFVDGLYLITQNAGASDKFTPYQITTVPSLAYYGKNPINANGVGIKLPGDTLYLFQQSTLGKNTYKMMVEGEKIKVGRYPQGTTKFETYKPSNQTTENCGMQIHRSSTKGKGVCVGPWSAGCQVFCDINEWNDFIAKAEKQTINNNKFFYALIEIDSIDPTVFSSALKGEQAAIASTTKTGKDTKVKASHPKEEV